MKSNTWVRKIIWGALVVMLAIGLSVPASAQTTAPPETRWISWSLFSRNDYGTGIAEDSRGNFFVSGYIRPYPDMLAAKFSSAGRKKWVRFPSGGYLGLNDFGHAALVTSDGDYLLAGSMGYWLNDVIQPGNERKAPCLIKFNSRGKILWEQIYKDFPQGSFNSVVEDINGDYVAAGYCAKDIEGNPGLLVVKVDTNGNQVGDYHQEAQGFLQSDALGIDTYIVDDNPHYIVTGYSVASSSSSSGIYIIKLDQNFSLLNQGFYYATGVDSVGYSVVKPVLDSAGRFVVAADVGGEFSLVRFSAVLSPEAPKFYGQFMGSGVAKSIKQNVSGLVVAGTLSTDVDSAAYVILVDDFLDLVWEWSYYAPYSFFGANAVIPTHDEGFAVCGYVYDQYKDPDARYDLFVAKLGGTTHGK